MTQERDRLSTDLYISQHQINTHPPPRLSRWELPLPAQSILPAAISETSDENLCVPPTVVIRPQLNKRKQRDDNNKNSSSSSSAINEQRQLQQAIELSLEEQQKDEKSIN
jgi:hypothetical protein